MQSKLVALTILASIGFFNYRDHFPQHVQRAMFMFMVIVCAVVAFTSKDSLRLRDIRFSRLPWLIYILGIIVSAFICPFYHQQTLTQTLVAQSTYIFTAFTFLILLKLNPDPKQLFKWFIILWGCAALTYAANFFTFPNNMFGEKLSGDTSRGMLRIFPQLFYLIILLIFWSINRWQMTRKLLYLAFAGGGYILIGLSLTRQTIVIVSLLVFLQLLSNVSWIKKILLGSAICGLGLLILVNLPMYKDMKELTEAQINDTVDGNKEDVRIGAWRFFAWEGSEETETWLLGNGTPSLGNSTWGKSLDGYFNETGYLLADVALASVIFQFGLITAIALLIILLMAAFRPKTPDRKYLTYFMLAIILHGAASGVFHFYYEMFIVMIGLYLIYRPEEYNESVRPDHFEPVNVIKHRRQFLIDC